MEANLTVTYLDGSQEKYTVVLDGPGVTGGARLDSFVEHPNLALLIDDQLVVIPAKSVKKYVLAPLGEQAKKIVAKGRVLKVKK